MKSIIEVPPSFSLDDLDLPSTCHWSIEGLERSGKSDLACSAPGPIAYIAFDANYIAPVKRWRDKGKVITVATTPFVIPQKAKAIKAADQPSQAEMNAIASTSRKIRDQFRSNYDWALGASLSKVRTVVIDTETMLWSLIRLARFGKLTQVPMHLYGAVNSEMYTILGKARASDKHTIWLRRLGKEWERSKPEGGGKEIAKETGRYVASGFKDTDFEVQSTIRAYRDEEFEWCAEVRNSSINGKMAGEVFSGAERSFRRIAARVYGNKPGDWK